jgi:Peptidase family M48
VIGNGFPMATRCGVALVALTLYGVASSFVVSREGRLYRESLRPAEAPARMPDKPEAPRAPTSEPMPAPTPLPKVVEPPSDPGKSKTIPGRATEPAKTDPGPKTEPIWDAPAVKKEWNLEKLTTGDEAEIGQAMHSLIVSLADVSDDGGKLGRVRDAAGPLELAVARKDVRYTYTILESSAFNAFSTPGGDIYLTRALVDAIGDDEIYALQFILAHEIAHVDLAHAILCLRSAEWKRAKMVGTLDKLYNVVIPGGYTEAQDLEADQWALARMGKLGYDRRQSLSFLNKLQRRAENDRSFTGGRPSPRPDKDASILDNHIRVHPSIKVRLERAKKYLDVNPPTPKR